MLDIKTQILNGVTRYIDLGSKTEVSDIFYWQGYFHAMDRYKQMELLRIVGSGQICELLDDSTESLAIDQFMREMGFNHYSKLEVQSLDPDTSNNLTSYCRGVNDYASKNRSLIFKLLAISYRPWQISDCILTLKIMSYIGLAQGQQDLEKFLTEMLKNGVAPEKIESLTRNQEKVSTEVIHLLKKINLYNTLLPESLTKLKFLPRIQASNNWAMKNGDKIIHACDPHLECNRLPSIWYEMQIKGDNTDIFGISMPGVPGIVMGVNKDISYSFTYGFMDMTDYFIEEIKDKSFRTQESFSPLTRRREIIKRKKNSDTLLNIYESKNGIIEYDSKKERIEDAFYLSLAWSCHKTGAASTFKAMCDLMKCEEISQMANILKNICISCNWIISDNLGNMTYQQSGLAPKRLNSGLFPLLGHNKKNQWQGFLESSELVTLRNPIENFLVTANNDMTRKGFAKVINSPMGNYRHDYITRLLKTNTPSYEQFKKMQSSDYSLQAELFYNTYKKLFEESLLVGFDFSYNIDSTKATLFEDFYKFLIGDFLADHFLGEKASSYLINETCIIADFYGLFDRFFLEELTLDENELWFKNKTKEDYIKKSLGSLVSKSQKWGEINKVDFNFLLTDGKLPAFLTRDRRDVPIKGNRSTISQGAVYRSKGRKTSFLPSWKMIYESGDSKFYTCLPGGLNDNPYSKFYQSDLDNWIIGLYRETRK